MERKIPAVSFSNCLFGKEEKKEQNVSSFCNSTELGGRFLSSLSSKCRVQVSSRSGCVCGTWGVTSRVHVPVPSHRQLSSLPAHFTNRETRGCSHNPQNKSLFAQTPLHWLGSVNQFPGSALWIIFPDFPEAMFYQHNLLLRKFFKVPFEIIWSGGKLNLAFLFFLSFPPPPLSKIPVLPAFLAI